MQLRKLMTSCIDQNPTQLFICRIIIRIWVIIVIQGLVRSLDLAGGLPSVMFWRRSCSQSLFSKSPISSTDFFFLVITFKDSINYLRHVFPLFEQSVIVSATSLKCNDLCLQPCLKLVPTSLSERACLYNQTLLWIIKHVSGTFQYV